MTDKRERLERQEEAKRRKIENGEEVIAPIYATEFSAEEIAKEERRPKKKAALLIGYSGSGYHGMQLYASPTWTVNIACTNRSLGIRIRKLLRETCLLH